MTGVLDFVILGAEKAGSSFLHACLAEHPAVFMPEQEVCYFQSPDYENSQWSSFLELFRDSDDKLRGIKRPPYLARAEVPARIKRRVPDVKLVAILRNPIDRAVAAYYHQVLYGSIPPRHVERGFRAIMDGKYERRYRRAAEILEFGLYHQHLQNYMRVFERRQLLLLLFDDLVADAREFVRGAYRFLGVDESYRPKALHQRPQAVIYSMSRLRFLALRTRFVYQYSKDRTRFYPKQQSGIDRIMDRLITTLDRTVCSRAFPTQRPALSPSLRERLCDFYARDVASLTDLLGRDVARQWLGIAGAGG